MWVIPSSLVWPSAPEWGGSSWGCSSPSQDTAVWLTLSGKPTQRPLSWREWKSRPWSQRLFSRAIWPTPDTQEGGRVQRFDQGGRPLEGEARRWPTPMAADDGHKMTPNSKISGLLGAARTWPTPTSRDHKDTTPLDARCTKTSGVFAERKDQLPRVAQAWPSPNAADADKGTDPLGARGGGDSLKAKSETWPTPRAEEREQTNSQDDYTALSHRSRSFHPALKTSTCGPECLSEPLGSHQPSHSPKHMRLNPRFGEWLMNWPDQLTEVE